MRPLLWRRPMGEKLRHAFYLDETEHLPFWRSVCKKTCTTLPPGGDEPGGSECGACCDVVAAPAIEDWERQHRVTAAGPNQIAQPFDVAELQNHWSDMGSGMCSKPIMLAMISCLRDAAMEAECMGEMSGYRVTLLARHGLTDSSDPAFGPVKYPDQGPKSEPEPF